jgi:hypothetical protein
MIKSRTIRIHNEIEEIVKTEDEVYLKTLPAEFAEMRPTHKHMEEGDYPVNYLDVLKAVAHSQTLWINPMGHVTDTVYANADLGGRGYMELGYFLLMFTLGYFSCVVMTYAGMGPLA